jgi:glycosyltransferase involved in cell wall biosynthesis
VRQDLDHKFSIITVNLNSGSRLSETVSSVLSQDFDDYEVIVKDGLSADGSVGSIGNDTRVRIISSGDSGIYDAMNQALAEARGEYVCFLNSGDCFCGSDVLGTAARTASSEGDPDIIYGDIFERTTGTTVRSNPVIDDFACYRNVPCHQACFYRRELISRHPFDTAYKIRADYEQFLWCHFKEHARTCYMPVTAVSYEGGGVSDSDAGRKVSKAEHRQITALYIPAGRRLLYRILMMLSFSEVRTALARSPLTARVYNKIKESIYRRKQRRL